MLLLVGGRASKDDEAQQDQPSLASASLGFSRGESDNTSHRAKRFMLPYRMWMQS